MRANKFANVMLTLGILYFFMMLTYAFHRIIYYDLNKYNVVLAIIFAIGVVICSLAFKWRPDYKLNLVLVGLSSLFGVYLIEIFLFFQESQQSKQLQIERVKLAKEMGIPFDTRTKRDIFKEFKEQGMKAEPSFFPRLLAIYNGLEENGTNIFPLANAMSLKKTVFCNENGEWITLDTDEYGFNNPTGLFELEGIDIMLIGDSFTHGYCVKREENIAGQLKILSGTPVLNLGSAASGPLIEFAILKEFGEFLKPKRVLWMYFEGNDLADLIEEQQAPLLLKYHDNQFSQHLQKLRLDKI